MNDRPSPLRYHLLELRRRLMWTVGFFIVATVVAFVFWKPIFRALLLPGGDVLNPLAGGRLPFTSITEAWSTTAKVCVTVGMMATVPFLLLQVVLFVRPGLKPQERIYLYILLPAGIVAFLAGVAFSYFVLLPPAIRFLATFGDEFFTPFVTPSSYVSVIVNLMLVTGLIFEMPLVMYFLARIGILRPRTLSKGRRWAVVLAFVAGAILTPTGDPVNQVLLTAPIIVMYEIGYWLVRLAELQRSRRAARVADTV